MDWRALVESRIPNIGKQRDFFKLNFVGQIFVFFGILLNFCIYFFNFLCLKKKYFKDIYIFFFNLKKNMDF